VPTWTGKETDELKSLTRLPFLIPPRKYESPSRRNSHYQKEPF
jgi:hypothetical protein